MFSLWTCFVLYIEYDKIASMRLHFLASQRRRAEQFTVLVRNVPPDSDESISEHVDHFFELTIPITISLIRLSTMQISLRSLLRGRKLSRTGLITTRSSIQDILKRSPLERKVFLVFGAKEWMPLNFTQQKLTRWLRK